MAQKSKVLVCDRPFKCPVCRRDFVIGDEIILLLPQRTRYCSPCGTNAIKRIDGTHDGSTLRQDIDRVHAEAGITPKPSAAQSEPASFVTLANYADQQTKLWKSITALEKQTADLTALVSKLQIQCDDLLDRIE